MTTQVQLIENLNFLCKGGDKQEQVWMTEDALEACFIVKTIDNGR